MDMTIVVAFVAFFAMVLGWMAAPTTGTRTEVTVTEPTVLVASEAHV